jgi:hypothetical protein
MLTEARNIKQARVPAYDVRRVALTNRGVLADPAPVVRCVALDESALDFRVRPGRSGCTRAASPTPPVHTALKEAGIRIPVLQREVRIIQKTRAAPEQDAGK